MRASLSSVTFLLCLFVAVPAPAADVTVDPTSGQVRISPYVYGANQVNGSSVNFTARRQGGNRMTGFNWENNFSNAGSDWQMSSDSYMCDTPSVCSAPGATITQYVDAARAAGAYSLVTLQMAGYVSADANGTVDTSEVAPSNRWKQLVARKGSSFSIAPDLSDGNVYMDELINFLVKRYGTASAGGILGYSLDNEPDLWSSTHPLIHPTACGAAELVQRSAELAAAVKDVDPDAEVFGFVSYGYAGFLGLQDAADWDSVRGNYEWYVQYFLAEMAAASQKAGKRLLDVIDLHFYSEATGNGTRIQSGTTENAEARVQATRSLWDSTYDYSTTDPTIGEDSWITQWNEAIRLIPRVREYIDSLYPGTKFAITEYDFGAANHISGGIAEADALGIFGREGLYFASRWGDPGNYTDAAYNLYLNYDGNGSRFGNISVAATSTDVVNVPVYAAVDETDAKMLHLILINRNLTSTQSAVVTIVGSTSYLLGQMYGFGADSDQIVNHGSIPLNNYGFSIELPALSAMHVVLSADAPVPITGVGGVGGRNGLPNGGSTNAAVGGGSTNGGDVSTTLTSLGVAKTPGHDNDSGCGCRVASRCENSKAMLVMLVAMLFVARRAQVKLVPSYGSRSATRLDPGALRIG